MKMYNPAHPGKVLKEAYLEPLELSVTHAAEGLDIGRPTLSNLLHGKAGVSVIMAIKLAKAFNTTPDFWLNMQRQYDLWKAEKKAKKAVAKVKIFSGHATV